MPRRRSDVLTLGTGGLRLADVLRVARQHTKVDLADDARRRMREARDLVVQMLDDGIPVYGVTTGFGAQSGVLIGADERLAMQPRILRSHAAGAGAALPDEVVRAILLLRANMLAHGYSGVRPEVAETLLDLLNKGLSPLVPAQGSVGASGDLAPLAHLSLALIGEGDVRTTDGVIPARDALATAGIKPLVLEAKEASSLTNGTEMSLALAALAVSDTDRLLDHAEIAAAMSFTAMGGHREAYDDRIHRLRPHPGQLATAARLREWLHTEPGRRPDSPRRPVHDIYTLRCIPQVLGPIREALDHVRMIIEVEMNSVTDNPVCLVESGEIVSGGNFHGHTVALACDYLKLAVASLGTFTERRIASLLDSRSSGLPDLLTPEPGANSGFMLAQYAAASIASENKILAHPSSVDSITTAAGAEDYNSMSATAARHLRQVVENAHRIVAIEFLCAAQALDLRGETGVSPVAMALGVIRSEVPFLESDHRIVSGLVDHVEDLMRSDRIRLSLRRSTDSK